MPYPLCYHSSLSKGMLRGFSWLCTQKLLLVVLGESYKMPDIKPRLAASKENALPAILSVTVIAVFPLFIDLL